MHVFRGYVIYSSHRRYETAIWICCTQQKQSSPQPKNNMWTTCIALKLIWCHWHFPLRLSELIFFFSRQTWQWMRWESLSGTSRRPLTRRSGYFPHRSPSARRLCPPVLSQALPVHPPLQCARMRQSPSLSPRTVPERSLLQNPWPFPTTRQVAYPRALTRAHCLTQTTFNYLQLLRPALLLRGMSSRETLGQHPLLHLIPKIFSGLSH